MPLYFYERPTSVPVFTNGKQSEEDCYFYEKGKKWKLLSVSVFSGHYRGSTHPRSRSGPASSFPRTTLSAGCQSCELCLWAPGLYLHLFCPSFSKKRPEVIASLLYAISAYKTFHRNALLSENREHYSAIRKKEILTFVTTWMNLEGMALFYVK